MIEQISIIVRFRLIIVRIEPNTVGSIQNPYGEPNLSVSSRKGCIEELIGRIAGGGFASKQRLVVGHPWRYIIDCWQPVSLTRGVMPLYWIQS